MTILRALLDAGRKNLTASEEKAFKGMLDDLEQGRVVRLSKAQRQWAEGKYHHLNLDRAYKDKAPPPRQKSKSSQPVEFPWQGKLPLKPPGKT